MPTVPEGQKVGVRGSHVDLAARALLRLADKTKGYKRGGVGIVGIVQMDSMGGDGDEGTFGKACSVGEGEGFTSNTRHAYYREKRR